MNDSIGIVIIGRNEGSRLVTALKSVERLNTFIVYVDSGSTDESVNNAMNAGARVVNLDMTIPFTAARARNAGYSQLKMINPELKYVQFIDGDCTVVPGWIESAVDYLKMNEKVAIVCGRRKELHPADSVYNHLCDIEWNTPVGEALACGGDFLCKCDAFDMVNGFTEELIAGEEPELCFRLRKLGWKIWRIDHDMTLHDASIYRFSQWWKRMKRAGFAFADGAIRHGRSPERYWVREATSSWIWAAFIPLIIIALSFFHLWLGILAISIYPIQVFRLYIKFPDMNTHRLERALYLVVGKFAEFHGQLEYIFKSATGKKKELIEYK